MRDFQLGDAAGVDQLADANPWEGGVVTDHRQSTNPARDERVDDTVRRTDAHEAADHHAGPIRDERRRVGGRNRYAHGAALSAHVVGSGIDEDRVSSHARRGVTGPERGHSVPPVMSAKRRPGV